MTNCDVHFHFRRLKKSNRTRKLFCVLQSSQSQLPKMSIDNLVKSSAPLPRPSPLPRPVANAVDTLQHMARRTFSPCRILARKYNYRISNLSFDLWTTNQMLSAVR